jgi:hypothetical protein
MRFLDVLYHLANFAAPALALALLMPWAGRWVHGRSGFSPRYLVQAGVGFAVGLAVLLGGLWWFGRDGKMATYGALVLAMGTAQWLIGAGWRGR